MIVTNKPINSSGKVMKVVREPYFADKVVIVNGLFGCGKTLMTAIVGSLDRVELMRFNYHMEHVCGLLHLGAIERQAASSLIRMQTDLDLHDSMMSRSTNFRFSDLSSVWRNSVNWRYLSRLIRSGDQVVIERIQTQRPILHLATHLLLGIGDILFDALGDRLRFVEVVRHPLYMLKQWYGWIHRAGSDPRAFEVWFDYKGHSLPWYARGWEDLWMKSNHMDRVIYCLDKHYHMGMEVLSRLSDEQRARALVIPFERFVLHPEPAIKRLEGFLDTKAGLATRRMMKKQKVPRKMVAAGIDLQVYKTCGWEPPDHNRDEAWELEKRRRFAAAKATPEAMAVLDRHSKEYEEIHYKGMGDF